MIQKIKIFFGEARQEFKHINWPTRQEAARLTLVVVFLALGLAVFLGFFDLLFSLGLKKFILKI